MADIECEQCGGTDFYKEDGFYFCKECQIQSQEVQEYAFEDFAADKRTKTKKVESKQTDKTDNRITSWECYNYILLGLTDELIHLGANPKLKTVVKYLWLFYLERLGVLKLGEDQLPRLQAVSSGRDCEIVYGKSAKRKRKRRKSSSSEATTMDSASIKRERIKRKRALIKAQYDDFSQKSQGTPSLHNETLTSLQTGSDKSSKPTHSIRYNVYALKEMRRFKKSRYHWHKHITDFENNLKCHKMSYRKASFKYRTSAHILSLNKLYSILYLGLLIIRDKIQLSDILRFIKEGKLSFNCYTHFFPDDFTDKTINFKDFKKNRVFANAPFRIITSEMSSFLKVQYYIQCANLVDLSERYCKELNLPDEICNCVKNILSRSDVKMSFCKRQTQVPNYEGRVLSIILFVVKLLFGLDDVTEFHLGEYANILNKTDLINPKMFNVIQWLKYIEYRELVMTKEHFVTNYSKSTDIDVSLALGHLHKKEYPASKCNEDKEITKQLLRGLRNEIDAPASRDLPTTFTPYYDYLNLIDKSKYLDILSKDFSGDSLSHILKPTQFLEIVNKGKGIQVVHGGANENWFVERITSLMDEKRDNAKGKRKFVTVKLSLGSTPKIESQEEEAFLDSDVMKNNFYIANENNFKKAERAYMTDLPVSEIKADSEECYPKHYNPHERFWMRTKVWIEVSNQKDCSKFLKKFPYNFQVVFKECQRIAQQNEHELLTEYQMTELHLMYLANYGKETKRQEILIHRLIASRLNKCVDLW